YMSAVERVRSTVKETPNESTCGDAAQTWDCDMWNAGAGHGTDAVGRCFARFEVVRVVDTGQPWGGHQHAICRLVPGHLTGWTHPLLQFQSPGRPSRRFR